MDKPFGCPILAECAKAIVDSREWGKLPKGWRYLGRGAYRVALLGPDGHVYKVDKWNDDGANEQEAEAFAELRRRGHRWVPKYHLHANGVMTLRRYKTFGTWEELQDHLNSDSRHLNRYQEISTLVDDIHSGNVGLNSRGNLILLDANFGTT